MQELIIRDDKPIKMVINTNLIFLKQILLEYQEVKYYNTILNIWLVNQHLNHNQLFLEFKFKLMEIVGKPFILHKIFAD